VESNEFSKYLQAISKITGRGVLDDFIFDLYWEALKNSKEGALEAAMRVFFTSNRWPSIDDIQAQMGEKTESLEDRARKVALEITDQITKRGYMAEKEVMQILSPVAQAVVLRNGGWVRICDVDDVNKLPWKQKDWMREALDIISTGRLGDLIGTSPTSLKIVAAVTECIRDTSKCIDFPGIAEKGRGESFTCKVGGKYRDGESLVTRYERISELT